MNNTEEQFRKVLGSFPTGVAVVTTSPAEGESIGITVSSFTSVSLEPPQVLFCLSKHSKTLPAFKAARYFAVNILSAEQSHLSNSFARRTPIEWESIKTHTHPITKCPLLSEAVGHVICEKSAVYEGGDHNIILGKAIDLVVVSENLPLIRHRGQYATLQPICP